MLACSPEIPCQNIVDVIRVEQAHNEILLYAMFCTGLGSLGLHMM